MPPATRTRAQTQSAVSTTATDANMTPDDAIRAIENAFATNRARTPAEGAPEIVRNAWEHLRRFHDDEFRRNPTIGYFHVWIYSKLDRDIIKAAILKGYSQDLDELSGNARKVPDNLGVERWELILYFGEFKQPKARELRTINNDFPDLSIHDLHIGIREMHCRRLREGDVQRRGKPPPPPPEFALCDLRAYRSALDGDEFIGFYDNVVDDPRDNQNSDSASDGGFDMAMLTDRESDDGGHHEIPNSPDGDDAQEIIRENNSEVGQSHNRETAEAQARQTSQQISHDYHQANPNPNNREQDIRDDYENAEVAVLNTLPLLRNIFEVVTSVEPGAASRHASAVDPAPTPPDSIYDGPNSDIGYIPPPTSRSEGNGGDGPQRREKSTTVDSDFDYKEFYRALKEEKLTAKRRCSSADRYFSVIDKQEQSAKPLVSKLDDLSTAIECLETRLKEYDKGTKVIAQDKMRQALERMHHTDPGAITPITKEMLRVINACLDDRGTKRRRVELDLEDKKKRKAKFVAECKELKRQQQQAPLGENTSAPSA